MEERAGTNRNLVGNLGDRKSLIMRMSSLRVFAVSLFIIASTSLVQAQSGFVKAFDGSTFNGWVVKNPGAQGPQIKDGMLVFPAVGGGDVLTDRDYSDFALKFEFKMNRNGNNGVGIRVPLDGHASYDGIELQILDDDGPMYKELKPWQYHGSIYGVVPALRGALKPVGQWNSQEVEARGRKIKVKVNGKTIVDADLNSVTDPAVIAAHPGILRSTGRIGFLGHGPEEVSIRNIWIKDLSKPERDNKPPAGFKALFNGRNLDGWKGLVADPKERATMSPAILAIQQRAADEQMKRHWKVVDGVLVYDGKGNSLATDRDYGDFEMWVDWLIRPAGDSGIYLRGSPQVQIWDRPEGSGGLYNNQINPKDPIKKADKPVGEWNRFKILMIGEKVTILLNEVLVVKNVTMENYWERDKPIYPTGQIELQHHGNELKFKNIYIREIPRKQAFGRSGVQVFGRSGVQAFGGGQPTTDDRRRMDRRVKI